MAEFDQRINGGENRDSRAGWIFEGDVSHLMPCVHPWVGCVHGTLHGADFELTDPQTAYIKTPEVLARSLIDLLSDDAAEADRICSEFKPIFSRESYMKFMEDLVRQE